MKIALGLFILALFPLTGNGHAASIEDIEASAQYVLGDNDSKLDGRRLALLEAKRNAIEKIGTYVESITEVRNLQLSHDQIRSYTVGIIEVQEVSEKWDMAGQNLAVVLTVKARIDRNEVKKQLTLLSKNSATTQALKESDAKIQEYERQIASLTQQLKQAKGSVAEEAKESRQKAIVGVEVKSLLMKVQVAVTGSEDETAGYILGSVSEAVKERVRHILDEALKLDPENPKTLTYLGALLVEEKDYLHAEPIVRKAVRLAPDEDFPHQILSFLLLGQGDLTGAIQETREALRLNPNNGWNHNNLAYLLNRQGDRAGAIRELREAIRLQPSLAIAHNNLGHSLREGKDFTGALQEFQEALRIKPDYAESHYGLGEVLLEQGDVIGAMREYREAIRLKPNYEAPHDGLGRALARRGDVPGAMYEFREAIRLEPDSPDSSMTHNNLGAMLLQEGYLQGAQQEFQDAIRLNPDNALAHYNLGLVLQRLGNWNGARKEFQEACRLKDYHSCNYLRHSAGCATVASNGSNMYATADMDAGLVVLMMAAPLRFIRKKIAGGSARNPFL